MTRKDALNKTIGILTYHQVNFCKSKEAVANMNEIIEALEKIDQEPCEDCIRRSDIGLTDFEIVMCNGDYKEGLKMLLDKIEKAPSVTAQPKMGQWIDIMVGDMPAQVCDQCNTFYPLAYTGGGHKYCPNCGCKMREVKG